MESLRKWFFLFCLEKISWRNYRFSRELGRTLACFNNPIFLFSLFLPQLRYIHKARPSQVFNWALKFRVKFPSPTRASPTAEELSVLLNTEADTGGLFFAPVPTSLIVSQTIRRAADPPWGMPLGNHPINPELCQSTAHRGPVIRSAAAAFMLPKVPRDTTFGRWTNLRHSPQTVH